MRISFDLDDTLILKSVEGPCEEALPPRRRGEAIEERLRQGTRELLSALHDKGWEILIYSNSYRGKTELTSWFSSQSMKPGRIAISQRHWVSLIISVRGTTLRESNQKSVCENQTGKWIGSFRSFAES